MNNLLNCQRVESTSLSLIENSKPSQNFPSLSRSLTQITSGLIMNYGVIKLFMAISNFSKTRNVSLRESSGSSSKGEKINPEHCRWKIKSSFTYSLMLLVHEIFSHFNKSN
jgi:hypothetical protein